MPGVGFVSVSNDELVKLWSLDGQPLRTLNGHTGFVFTVKCLSTGEVASAGDDCTVKIWDVGTGECKQTIGLPRTVWSVTENSLGDLIIGSEDYKVRTFTRDHARAATGDELATFNEELSSKTTSTDMD